MFLVCYYSGCKCYLKLCLRGPQFEVILASKSWDLMREPAIPWKLRETDWNRSGNYMYRLLLNNAMSMCCKVLMISGVYVPNSINPMVFVIQIHSALRDAATELLCVIYINFNCNILLRQPLEEKFGGRSEKPWLWNGLNCHTVHIVRCRPLITQTWVWYQVNPYKIYGGQSALGQTLLLWFTFPVSFIPPILIFIFTLLLPEKQLVKDWEPSEKKKQRSFSCVEATDRKVFWFFFFAPSRTDFKS